MTNGPLGASAATPGGSRNAPQSSTSQAESGKEKKDLASWWKTFKKSEKKNAEPDVITQGIFGVPLQTSIRYANVAISLFNDEGQSYIYGYVPIVVAKCGVFLKEKATDVEGIFRLAGSEKRIKELKVAFDSPDRYGKGLDWTGYTVHDAANILRRYFNQLPEPIIPLDFYQRFRDPLRNREIQAAVVADPAALAETNPFNHDAAIREYQKLITELPPLNRQLLLYILDLLAVFASKSDLNKMTTPNLAAIFQPGILNHPQHDMAPQEYRLSQDILIFLIENQDSFLIGMQGTAADAETVREVQSGSPTRAPSTPTTPNRSKTVIHRSGSNNSSVAAESVRKWGSIRRNVSVSSSKGSKRSELGPGPATPTLLPSGSVHRSNTLPSKRNSAAAQSPRVTREKKSDPSTPTPGTPGGSAAGATILTAANATPRPNSMQSTPTATTAPEFPIAAADVMSASSSEVTTPLATIGSDASSAVTRDFQTPKKDTTPLLAPPSGSTDRSQASVSATPASSERKFFNILKQSPGSENEGRKPNKLQKKRIPGSALSSAHSSSHSLPETAEPQANQSTQADASNPAAVEAALTGASASGLPHAVPQRHPTDATLKPTISPSHSFHSHTSTSDADLVGDDMPTQISEQAQTGKKQRRWRLSRPVNKLETPNASGNAFGNQEQSVSRTTIGSIASQPRRSMQQEPPTSHPTGSDVTGLNNQSVQPSSTDPVFSDSERERKGLFSRIRDKIRENKDNKDAEKQSRGFERGHDRTKSRQDLVPPTVIEPAPTAPMNSTAPATEDAMAGDAAIASAPGQASNSVPATAHDTTNSTVAAAALPTAVQPPPARSIDKSIEQNGIETQTAPVAS